MKCGKIALKIRYDKTRFGSFVAGATELELAMQGTLMVESAFVVPLGESASPNQEDSSINQKLVERFGIVVAIKADITQKDKPNILAYDTLYDCRSEIFKAILGWQPQEAESIISYRGGSLLGIDGAWLWYQFEFEYTSRIQTQAGDHRYADIMEYAADEDDGVSLPEFEKLYTNFIQAPNPGRLPYTDSLPLPDGYPDVLIPNMAQMITRRDPTQGAFNFEYSSAFPIYDADRRI